jgi:hypothetical protein
MPAHASGAPRTARLKPWPELSAALHADHNWRSSHTLTFLCHCCL